MLSDPAVLAGIAKNGNDTWASHTAVLKISNRALLEDIATHAKDADVRKRAAAQLDKLKAWE